MISATVEHRVQMFECDPMRIVWNGRYFDYFEMARNALYDDVLHLDRALMEKNGVALPLVKNSARYLKPLKWNDRITITATLASHDVELVVNFVIRNGKGEVTTKGSASQAMVDTRTGNLVLPVDMSYFTLPEDA